MAVTAVATGNNSANASTSVVVSITITAGSNRALGIGVSTDGSSSTTVTSITGAGASGYAEVGSIDNGTRITRLWKGINPTTGAQSVTINFNQATDCVAGVVEFDGADQTDPIPNAGAVTNTGSSTTPTVDKTGASGNMTFAAATARNTFTATNQTSQWLTANNTGGGGCTAAGTGSPVTHNFTVGGSTAWSIIAAEVVVPNANVTVALSGSASTSAAGTQAPGISVPL